MLSWHDMIIFVSDIMAMRPKLIVDLNLFLELAYDFSSI